LFARVGGGILYPSGPDEGADFGWGKVGRAGIS